MNDQTLTLAELIWLKMVRAQLGADTSLHATVESPESRGVKKIEREVNAEREGISKSQ